MKVLKGFFLSGLIFVLALILVFLQIHMTLNKTVFSADYFIDSFDKNNISTTVKDIFFYKVNNISLTTDDFQRETPSDSSQDTIPSLNVGERILEYIDQDWFEEQTSVLAKGTYSYLMSRTDELPTIEIGSFRQKLLDGLVDELLSREEMQSNLEAIHSIFTEIDSKLQAQEDLSDEELVDEILNLNMAIQNNLDRDVANIVLQVYKDNKEKEIENIDREIVSRIFASKFNFNEIDSELNLNEVLDVVFPNNDDPLTSLRSFFWSYRTIISGLLLTLILILIAIICLTNFNISGSLNWLASSSIIAGLTTLVFGLLGFFPLITKVLYYNVLSRLESTDKIESLSNLQLWIEGYISKFFNTLIVHGSFLIVLSIVFFIAAAIVSRYTSKADAMEEDLDENQADGTSAEAIAKTKSKPFIALVTILRVVVVLVLLVLLPFVIKWGFDDFMVSINDFRTALDSNSGSLENIDLTELIPEIIIGE